MPRPSQSRAHKRARDDDPNPRYRASLYDDIPCVIAETSTLVTRGIECALYKWSPPPEGGSGASSSDPPLPDWRAGGGPSGRRPRGVAVVYHGFGAHSLYPTVRYASSLLAESGLLVYGLDLPGHGASPGRRGLLTGVDDLIEDGVAVAVHAAADASSSSGGADLPLFLVGSSMGGAIALAVAHRMGDSVSGVVMLAPMLSLSVGPSARRALGLLSAVAPTVPLIPSSATSPEMQYRDAERRAECERNTLTYKGYMRPQSALTCVEFTNHIQKSFDKVNVPFLCMIAEEDVVVDNSVAKLLMRESPSRDKTLKSYAALHGLLCEPAPLLGIDRKSVV